MPLPRKLTDEEKDVYKKTFPKLDVDKAVVSGEATSIYNCIAWTVGVTTRWIWPGENLADFDKFYKSNGYVRSSSGPIAAWGVKKTGMTHGSISGTGHGPRWESKCGQGLRIQHGLGELVGANYGRVIAFYEKSTSLLDGTTEFEQRLEKASNIKEARKMKLRKQQADALKSVLKRVDESIVAKFEQLFKTWKETWEAPHTLVLSDPGCVRYSKEYAELASMGDEIVPLLIEKLTDPKNFLVLQLYDALQADSASVVEIEPDDDAIFEGEQGRAQRTVERWIANL